LKEKVTRLILNRKQFKNMKTIKQFVLAALCGAVMLSTAGLKAAEAKTYQVTGPVSEVTPTTITVQKGDEKWQLARDKNTKGGADVKVGSKVTVYYQMVASEVEVKDAKPKK
jgi:hypothetical protein